jgi:hypothetical protein
LGSRGEPGKKLCGAFAPLQGAAYGAGHGGSQSKDREDREDAKASGRSLTVSRIDGKFYVLPWMSLTK